MAYTGSRFSVSWVVNALTWRKACSQSMKGSKVQAMASTNSQPRSVASGSRSVWSAPNTTLAPRAIASAPAVIWMSVTASGGSSVA